VIGRDWTDNFLPPTTRTLWVDSNVIWSNVCTSNISKKNG